MSRGHGRVQREILAELASRPAGSLLLVGDGGSSYRRAAQRLAAEGHVRLKVRLLYGRRRLVALSPEASRVRAAPLTSTQSHGANDRALLATELTTTRAEL